jgi:hypothetical protein
MKWERPIWSLTLTVKAYLPPTREVRNWRVGATVAPICPAE